MPFESLHDLSTLSSDELYMVYLAIARADHQWRVRALYGDTAPPAGHNEFRPLSRELFSERLATAKTMVGGESVLRQRLSRQAAAYGVNVEAELSRLSKVA